MSDKNNDSVERVAEAAEDIHSEDLLVEMGEGKQDNELEIVQDYLPEKEDYKGKTRVTKKQARQLALIRQMRFAFPELEEDTIEFLIELTEDYERYLTSVEGQSRMEHTQILKSIFGANSEQMEQAQATLMSAISTKIADEDE